MWQSQYRARKLNAPEGDGPNDEEVKEVTRVLQEIERLQYTLETHDVEVPSIEPPEECLMRMTTVKNIIKGRLKGIWVVEDENREKPIYLDKNNDMFDPNHGRTGVFHTGESGIAGVGDGGDYGIHFWVVSQTLSQYLISYRDHLHELVGGHVGLTANEPHIAVVPLPPGTPTRGTCSIL